MNSQNSQPAHCDIRFGLSGLRHPSLRANFYPSDIPDDWLLDYYSNEFSLILMTISELVSEVVEQTGGKQQSEVILADAMHDLYEDLIGEDFVVLLDVANAPDVSVETLLPESLDEEKQFFLVDLNKMNNVQANDFEVSLKGQKFSRQNHSFLFYYVTEQRAIEAVKLKQLINRIREQAQSEKVTTVNVIFSDSENALENCRNAILLESMM